MEAIFILIVATTAIIGCVSGNLFACIFTTLAMLPVIAIGIMAANDGYSLILVGGLFALIVAWVPYFVKRLRYDPHY